MKRPACPLKMFILLETDILHREKNDIQCNDYGYNSSSSVKIITFFIVNGLIEENKLTCKDSSTVVSDIFNAFLFKLLKGYIIHDYSNSYSDVHCPITFEICSKYSRNSTWKQFSWCYKVTFIRRGSRKMHRICK